jgi:8-oxo-dGTP pyrophosphatase MutT (NUDIX family)
MSRRAPSPWKRVGTGRRHDYGVLRIREDRVEDPRTKTRYPRVIIETPEWVNIIPLTRDGRVVMIRQFRFGVAKNTLEIPGGMVDPGETPRHAAIRELEEETGYRPGQVISLGSVHPNPAIQVNRCHSFLALDCVKAHPGSPEPSEDIAVELRKWDEIPRLICAGRITHALVIAAFHLERLRRSP